MYFFLFMQKTAYDMRISDWSSDVCSSDLFLKNSTGTHLLVFMYLGAKHMVTGYDHLLFLFGVVFFLYRMRDVGIYVTLFAVGHSLTLLYGVLGGVHVNPYLVDAIIGLSVVYKAMDNLGGFKRLFGVQPNTKVAVLVFGFFHGFGLATQLQDFELSSDEIGRAHVGCGSRCRVWWDESC